MCYAPLLEYGGQALADCRESKVTVALEQAVLANIVNTGLVSLMVLDEYNCAIAHSVYYGLVLFPGFEERWFHGNVFAYGVLVQLAVDGAIEEMHRMKAFMKKLDISSSLAEMEVSLDRETLRVVLTEIVTGRDMIYEAMKEVEK